MLRSQRHRRFIAPLLLCAMIWSASFVAARATAAVQQPRGGSIPRTRQRQLLQRQQQAIAALRETAEAARSFADLFYRVKIQAAAAGELWPFDEPLARSVLRRAWEATIAPGALDAIRQDEETPETARENLEMAQRMVIEQAARHDTRMAESLLQQSLSVAAGDAAAPAPRPDDVPAPAAARQGGVWRQLSSTGRQRLEIAYSLLRAGEDGRAAEIAAPVANEGASPDLMEFIFALRAQDAGAADALYLRLLERTRSDAEADANDVLLLATPVVSPLLQVFIDKDGAARFLQRPSAGATADGPARPAPSPPIQEIRRAFFDVAAAVLLRPPPARAADAKGDGGTAAPYFTIGRLLPFFEREAPQYAAALHARQSALAAGIEAGRREFLSTSMGLRTLSRKNPGDPLAPTFEALDRAADAKSRDRLRFDIVIRAAWLKLWDRARHIAAEIEDADAQTSARLFIALCQMMSISEAYGAAEMDDFERAANFVRAADVPPAARATGFAQAAELAARRRQRRRAGELLAEAATFAGQVSPDTKQRAAVFAMLTLAAARIEVGRATEMFAAFVSAANGAGDAIAYELSFEFEVGLPGEKIVVFLPKEPFRLEDVFATMARLDFARTVSEVRTLKDDVTRAEAMLTVARTVLHPAKEKRRRA